MPPDTLPARPVLHAYVLIVPLPAAALAAKTTLYPEQIELNEAEGDAVGMAPTVMVPDALTLPHPPVSGML